jgi:hypothetical protein
VAAGGGDPRRARARPARCSRVGSSPRRRCGSRDRSPLRRRMPPRAARFRRLGFARALRSPRRQQLQRSGSAAALVVCFDGD